MADPRLTVVKMLMKMDSSEAYSNLLLDHVFSETDLSERDKAFAAALFYGVLERRLTLDYIIEKTRRSRLQSWIQRRLRYSAPGCTSSFTWIPCRRAPL